MSTMLQPAVHTGCIPTREKPVTPCTIFARPAAAHPYTSRFKSLLKAFQEQGSNGSSSYRQQQTSSSTATTEVDTLELGLATEVLQDMRSSLEETSNWTDDTSADSLLQSAIDKQRMLVMLLKTQSAEGSSTESRMRVSKRPQELSKVYMAAAVDKGLKKKTMEDRHTLATICHREGPIDDWHGGVSLDSALAYAAVFDGHGGHMTAAHAARQFHHDIFKKLRKAQQMQQYYAQQQQQYSRQGSSSQCTAQCDQLAAALRNTFVVHDKEWHEQTMGMPFDGSGTTAVVALANKHSLFVANAGDSVAVLARGGHAVRLSELHKPDVESEAARIVAAGGMLYPGRSSNTIRLKQDPATLPAGERYAKQPTLAVTRALGDYKLKRHHHPILTAEPYVSEAVLNPADSLLLLTSDGVTDVLTDQQMMEVALEAVEQARPSAASPQDLAQAAASAVKAKALEAGAWDNLTSVAMLMDWTQ